MASGTRDCSVSLGGVPMKRSIRCVRAASESGGRGRYNVHHEVHREKGRDEGRWSLGAFNVRHGRDGDRATARRQLYECLPVPRQGAEYRNRDLGEVNSQRALSDGIRLNPPRKLTSYATAATPLDAEDVHCLAGLPVPGTGWGLPPNRATRGQLLARSRMSASITGGSKGLGQQRHVSIADLGCDRAIRHVLNAQRPGVTPRRRGRSGRRSDRWCTAQRATGARDYPP